MKKITDRKLVKFYVLTGMAYLLIWLISVLVNKPEEFGVRARNYIWNTAYITVLNFILLEYILPFFKWTWKRVLLGLLLIWGQVVLYSFGLYVWRALGIWTQFYTALREFESVEKIIEFHMGFSVASILFFGLVKHIYNYIKLKQAAQQLQIEKQHAELNYLKSQTNPHFLFNTLNNIYSLSRDKSDQAPESVLRLSKILRFMLYETSGDYIAIEQEIKIINDYIALEKLRYDETLHVNFNYDIEDMKQALPPLLLIPLVENAFKHGASESRHRPFVDLHLSVKERRLRFIIKNSTGTPAEERIIENIGLSNLRRQLELLYREFELSLQHEGSGFIAHLTINLASHV